LDSPILAFGFTWFQQGIIINEVYFFAAHVFRFVEYTLEDAYE
jgi:hypothetical protein